MAEQKQEIQEYEFIFKMARWAEYVHGEETDQEVQWSGREEKGRH